MKRILIVKLWALGDILMATPLLRALKDKWPDCEITWLADKDYVDILHNNPLLHETISFDSGRWRRYWRYAKLLPYWRMSQDLRRDLRRRDFDIVITLTAEKWWSVWFQTAPVRVGLIPRDRPGLVGRLYTHAVREAEAASPHNTDKYLVAAAALGCSIADKRMVIGRMQEEEAYAENLLVRSQHRPGDPVVVLAPFSTGANRCWEPERYAELSDWLWDTYRATCVITLGPKDVQAARNIASAARAPVVLAEGATIREYVALIQRADLVVCSDSSAMHIAGASGTPYIALFGSTSIESRAPLVGPGIALAKPLPCAPCDSNGCVNPVFRRCMKILEVADVLRAARTLLPQPSEEAHEPHLAC